MIIFFDMEVFREDYLGVFVDPIKKEEYVLVNNADDFRKFFDEHKNYIFVGFNNREYDNYIIQAILAGYNPWEVNDFIINKKQRGYLFDDSLRNYKFLSYDCYVENGGSLKRLEGYLGLNIHESSVDFNLNRKLTEKELEETINYCRSDVAALIEVFCRRADNFKSFLMLVRDYNLPMSDMNKTSAQITATILGAEKHEYNDEWNLIFPPNLEIEKYKFVIDWFKDPKNHWEGAKLECEIAGAPCVFGYGGIHLARTNYFDEGYFIMADVSSLYPSMVCQYNLMSRSVPSGGFDEYKDMRDKRVEYKHQGLKGLSNSRKLCLNALYGVMNYKYSPVYDPRCAHSVCITGQLLLLDLIEHVEHLGLICQANTDAVYIKLNKTKSCIDEFYRICKEWEKRTRLELEYDPFIKIAQRDINSYVCLMEEKDKKGNDVIKGKGAVVKKLSDLDYDLPIINFAVKNYLIYGTPVEKTIQDNDNLIDFQKIYHVSALYDRALKNCTFSKESYIKPETGRRNTRTVWNNDGIVFEHERTFRVFASKDSNDGKLYKQKLGKNPESFAGTSDHCFIENGNIVGKKCSEYVDKLDKQWYIDEAWRRIEQFYGKSLR